MSTRKYQHSVSGVTSGCALGNSLNIMLIFSCTPLLLSRYSLSTLQYRLRCTPTRTEKYNYKDMKEGKEKKSQRIEQIFSNILNNIKYIYHLFSH